MYAGWGFSDYFENCEPMSRRPWYESTRQNLLQLNMQVSALDIQEHRYELDQERLISPKGMKSVLVLCLLFSFFNIILPLSLSVFSFSNEVIPFIQASSLLFLTVGLFTTFWYFAKMLVWKWYWCSCYLLSQNRRLTKNLVLLIIEKHQIKTIKYN